MYTEKYFFSLQYLKIFFYTYTDKIATTKREEEGKFQDSLATTTEKMFFLLQILY